jgi:Rrf2 family protein
MQLLASEEYGLRCLLRLAACEPGGPVPISRIAAAEGLSPEYTAKLMRRLRLGELVTSVRGAEGGYRLARPAAAITVWSALETLGGEFFPDGFCDCHPGPPAGCPRRGDCALRALWHTLQRTLREALERITLEDLRRDESAMAVWLESRDPRPGAHKELS